MNHRSSVLGWSLRLAVLLLLSGCAATPPRTVPVTGTVRQQLVDRLAANTCPRSLDLDVDLRISRLAQEEHLQATLQLQAGRLRLAILDPLARPLFLLTIRDNLVTAIDTRHGQGYSGSIRAPAVAEYVPPQLSVADLLWLFSGCGQPDDARLVEVRRQDDRDLWVVLERNGLQHHLLYAEKDRFPRKHLVVDEQGEVIIEATYGAGISGACSVPEEQTLTGRDLPITLSLDIDRLYGCDPLPDSLFQLTVPPHFRIIPLDP